MAKKKITLTTVKSLKPNETLWDTEVKGFGVRCQKDRKHFVLKYSINKRQRFYTIGAWSGELTPDQARQEAEILRGQVRKGIDPMAEKERDKQIPLVKDAFDKFLEEIETKRSRLTHESYKSQFKNLAKKEIGNYQVNAVARADIARLHNNLRDTPYSANRLLAVLSSFFSWCIKNGHRTDDVNPCRHIDRFKEQSRERLLSEDELFRLGTALVKYEKDRQFLKDQPHAKKKKEKLEENLMTPYVTAAIRLLILTGARRNEILTLKWRDVDFKNRLIRLQESKTGKKTIYLSAPALQLLSDIPRLEDNPFVICGRKAGARLVNIKKAWLEIRESAELDDVRLHDLRHNYASTAVVGGHHLKVIGSLLGHANTKMTERYAHLANDPLQAANESISRKIQDAMTKKPKRENIVKLGQGRH